MLMSALEGRVSYSKVLYKWIIVYLANFIGSVSIAYLILASGLWKGGDFLTGGSALKIANAKVSLLERGFCPSNPVQYPGLFSRLDGDCITKCGWQDFRNLFSDHDLCGFRF